MGEMIRYILGFKAELELNNIRRRATNGKCSKVAADKDPQERKLVGTGTRRYGYAWKLNDKHKREGFTLNLEIVYEVSYDEKREAHEKLGIAVHVYKKGNEHRVKMECKPTFIVSILS